MDVQKIKKILTKFEFPKSTKKKSTNPHILFCNCLAIYRVKLPQIEQQLVVNTKKYPGSLVIFTLLAFLCHQFGRSLFRVKKYASQII